MSILIIHPIIQGSAIVLAMYAAYLGLQRTRSLHFGVQTKFQRNLHVGLGTTSLITLLGGMAGGLIITARFIDHQQPLDSLHSKGAMVLLPFLLIGILTGFYLYLAPPKGKALSVIHGINNVIILCMLLFQIYTGIRFFSHISAG